MGRVIRTVDDALRDLHVIHAGRTRYAGQQPRDDELLVAEIERLRRIERIARAYYLGYCQDEAENRDCCVSDQQHADAQELRDALAPIGRAA
jgi:hypothetical protein